MQSLLADVDESIDHGLWGVLRAMQERAMLLREAATLARRRRHTARADQLESRARDCDNKTRAIRALLQDSSARGLDATAAPREDVSSG